MARAKSKQSRVKMQRLMKHRANKKRLKAKIIELKKQKAAG